MPVGMYDIANIVAEAQNAAAKRLEKEENPEVQAGFSKELAYLFQFLTAVVDEQVDQHFANINRIHMFPVVLRPLAGTPIKVHPALTPLAYYAADIKNPKLTGEDINRNPAEYDEALVVENQHISLSVVVAMALLAVLYDDVISGDAEFKAYTKSYHIRGIPQEYRDALFKIREVADYETVLKEFNFLLIHEFLHLRLGHMLLRLRLKDEYPVPASVYNIATDLFIHLLMMSFPEFIESLGAAWTTDHIVGAPNNNKLRMSFYDSYSDYLRGAIPEITRILPVFKHSVRPLVKKDSEDEEFIKTVISTLQKYGINATKEELQALLTVDSIINEGVHEMDDEGVIIWLYEKFREFFENFEELADEVFDEVLQEMENQQNCKSGSQQDSESSQVSNQGEPDDKGASTTNAAEDTTNEKSAPKKQENSEGQNEGDSEDQAPSASKSLLEEAMNAFEKKMQDRLEETSKNNEAFRESAKGLATTAGLPDLKQTFLEKLREKLAANASKGTSDVESARGENFLRQLVEEIEESVKQQGFTPGFGRKLRIKKSPRPKFIDLLRKFGRVNQVGGLWPSYSVPNKKLQDSTFLFPTQMDHEPKLAIIVDTSGSMSDIELGLFLGMVKYVMRAFPSAKFHFLWNDAAYSVTEYTGRQYTRLERDIREKGVTGGGGSVFVDVFYDKLIKDADMLIFVSDFYISLPEKIVKKPIVLVNTPNYDPQGLKVAKKIFPNSLVYPLKSKEFEPKS